MLLSRRANEPEPEFREPPRRAVAAVGAFVGEDLLRALNTAGAAVSDLSGLSPREAALAHGGGLVMIDHARAGAADMIQAFADERPNTAMLLLADNLSAPAVRALLRLRGSDILPAKANLPEIVASLAKLNEIEDTQSTSGAAPAAQCWAFMGAVGGAGSTTLAIETAHALAARSGKDTVCLIDLNLADGMTAAYLDGQQRLDVDGLSTDPSRLDETLLRAYCWSHDSGFCVVAAPRDPEAEIRAGGDGVLSLLDVACSTFRYVVLDMPRHRLAWSTSVLSAVDEALIVSELTVPSLHAAADVCRDVDRLREGGGPARLVLNRMFPKRQQKSGFSIQQAERAIQRGISATVSSDWFAAREAVNLGIPVAAAKAKSPLVRDVEALVEKLAPAKADRRRA